MLTLAAHRRFTAVGDYHGPTGTTRRRACGPDIRHHRGTSTLAWGRRTDRRSTTVSIAKGEGPAQPLSGGALLAAVSSSMVAILRDHYGRGPMKAKTYALDDLLIVVLRGSGFTAWEQ